MKKIFAMIFSVALSLTVSATDYDTIWKKYCEAVEKDMYQDAQEQLQKIEKLAEKDPVLAAVYHTIKQDYDKALANPDLLAREKSTPWKRIINKGADDALWNNDLLSIIGHQAGRCGFLKEYYDSIGNRKAACVELFFEVRNLDVSNDELSMTHKRQMLESGMQRYKDIEEVALLAQEYYTVMLNDDDISNQSRHAYLLDCISRYRDNKYVNFFKNQLNDITCSQFELSVDDKLILRNVRNIGKLAIEFLPLRADGKLDLNTDNKADMAKLLKLVDGKAVQVISRDYSSRKPWEIVSDTLERPQLPVGVYLVKTSANGLVAYEVMYNSDIAILALPLDKNRQRLVAVSATTGKGIPSCNIVLSQEERKKTAKTYTTVTSKDGEAVFSGDFRPNNVYAYTSTDKAFEKRYYYCNFHYYGYKEEEDILTLFTDRAIYRPGQTIKGSIVAHKAADIDSIHVVPGRQVNISIMDAEYKEIYTDSIITDAHGNAGFEFAIPKNLAKNGRFSITAKTAHSVYASTFVRVEEYKRPTFDVNVVRDDTRYASPDSIYLHGDSVAVAFEAKTFTSLPVSNAVVEYTVKRRPHFFRFSTPRLIAENVKTVTDSEGRVVIPLHVTLPEEGFSMFIYEITAKVTGKDGESREARTYVRARTANSVWKDFFYASDNGEEKSDKPKFEVSDKAFPQQGNVLFTVKDTASRQPLYVRYSLFADDKCIESGTFTVKGSYLRKFSYKKEYGEVLSLRCVAIRNGQTYTFAENIKRPQPDLRLTPVWNTFRDKTQPGALETWSLRVNSSKGNPVGYASMIATIYDKSLDAEARLSWSAQIIQNSFSLDAYWRINDAVGFWCSKYATYKNLTEKFIDYARFKLLNYEFTPPFIKYDREVRARGRKPLMKASTTLYAAAVISDKNLASTAVGSYAAKEELEEESNDSAESGGIDGGSVADLSTLVRTDLGETAYFTPSLVADKDGNMTISFTMPETMTTWRFLGFVHDDKMRHAFVDTTCVARKDIIVKPNVPRFLREGDRRIGDRPVFASTVSNTTDKDITADVIMQLLSSDAEKVVWEKKTSVALGANRSEAVALEAPVITFSDSVLVYRVVASVPNGASDGEQHYIPVLPAVEETTTTIAFTQRGDSLYTTDIKDLLIKGSTDRRMTVRFTANAEGMVLDAIPHIIRPEHKDAMSLAAALYVGTMYPAQTPDTLVTSLARELRELQRTDGSWSWWKGMEGSAYMTASVARYFARLHHKYIGTAETDSMLQKAMPYLLNVLSKEVKDLRKMKSLKGVHPSELATDILYICALQRKSGKTFGTKAEADIKFLIGLMEKVPAEFTIYGKAHSAVILALYGKKAKALEFIESMKQYSVYTQEAGRFYDTRKAFYSWRNYKIPTEVAVIEALRIVCPDDQRTVEEMQQWLLHEKRTQQWDNSANTADAVWAFISGNHDLDLDRNIVSRLTLGDKEVKDGETVGIEQGQTVFSAVKDSKGTAWGGLLVTQRAPLSSVKTRGTGFSIKHEILGEKKLAAGSKVTVRLTIVADRDYDFVKVTDNHAACLEPVRQLSGYEAARTEGLARGSWSGYYRESKDRMTNYYFDKMARGTHIIETEYYVDREGRYQQGVCTVSCAYAPEFSAMEASKVLEVN